jgi:hypothetical protein
MNPDPELNLKLAKNFFEKLTLKSMKSHLKPLAL